MNPLYPEIEPHDQGMLDVVSDGNPQDLAQCPSTAKIGNGRSRGYGRRVAPGVRNQLPPGAHPAGPHGPEICVGSSTEVLFEAFGFVLRESRTPT